MDNSRTLDPLPCTARDDAPCGVCGLSRDLNCRWQKGPLYAFIAVALPTFAATLILLGIIWLAIGTWWQFVAYFVIILVYFLIAEIRFLCSHCPYYARPGSTLRCIGNYGALRIWKYNPHPLKPAESAAMILLVLTFYLFIPVIAGGYTIWMVWQAGSGLVTVIAVAGILVMGLLGSLTFYTVMQVYGCARCVNFSCPLNRVGKPVRDEYLRKNDAMREAWEESGYILEP